MKKYIVLIMNLVLVIALHQINFFDASGQQYRNESQIQLLKGAAWITDKSELPVSDSLFYLDHPAPLLRTEFNISGEIKKLRYGLQLQVITKPG